jgi:16S rRNA U516 pseudouridylate synthase RsuA-like enzyme
MAGGSSELGTRADPTAVIVPSARKGPRRDQQSRLTILLHKPIGYVSGQPEPGLHAGGDADSSAETQHCTPDTPAL